MNRRLGRALAGATVLACLIADPGVSRGLSVPTTTPRPVPVPSVAAPSIATPAVSSPAGTVPPVGTPPVSPPSAVAAPAQAAALSVIQVTNASVQSIAPASSQVGVIASAPTAATQPAPGPAAASQGSGAAGGGRPATGRGSGRLAGLSSRYLRRRVAPLRGCLSAIAPRQARALELRTGIGLRRSYSVAEAARALGVSVARETRIERSALAALTDAARAGRCPPPSHGTAIFPVAVQSPQPPVLTVPGAPSAGRNPPAKRHSISGTPSSRRAPRSIQPPSRPPGSGVSVLGYLILALLLAMLAAQLVQRPRSRRPPAPPTDLASILEREGGLDRAIAVYRRADARGDAAGSATLGVLLERQGDVDGALAAYRRADARGDASGAFNLGCRLAELGDLHGAVDAFRRADERGDAGAAANLEELQEHLGSLGGASAA